MKVPVPQTIAESSSWAREDTFLLSSIEEGNTQHHILHDGAHHEGPPPSSEIMFNFSEAITEELQYVKETMVDVVNDVAEELQHTYNDIQHPEDTQQVSNSITGMTRTRTLLPGNVAQAGAVTEFEAIQDPGSPDTASLTASAVDTIGSMDDLGKCIKSYDAFGPVDRNKTVIVTDPKKLVGSSVNDTAYPSGPPLVAYLLLISAVIGLSSIGPLLNLQCGVDPTMKIVWRNFSAAVALIPLVLLSVWREGLPRLSRTHVIVLFLTGASYAGFTVFFAWSLEYTTINNTVVLGNCQAILFLVGRVVMGQAVSFLEGMGAVIAFAGAAICSREAAKGEDMDMLRTATDSTEANSTLKGDALAIMSAVSCVAYLVTAKTVRPVMNLYVFMCCVMFLASVDALFLAYMSGIDVTWDRDPNKGVFGWMNPQGNRLPLELIMVVSCQFIGAMGKLTTFIPIIFLRTSFSNAFGCASSK
eukprot:scaffold283_cov186-Amphora_coffeaeformis.AAC.6